MHEQGDEWSDQELREALTAYLDMQRREVRGEKVVKIEVYRRLSRGRLSGRSPKSIEFRFQNISAVMALLGRPWIWGLKPRRNVGANVILRIEALLAEIDGLANFGMAEFGHAVEELRLAKSLDRPPGRGSPGKKHRTGVAYERDPKVTAWVLRQAAGNCEVCRFRAPFSDAFGEAFLELHYITALADSGADAPENALAACPNCHRALHYAGDRVERLVAACSRIERLRPLAGDRSRLA